MEGSGKNRTENCGDISARRTHKYCYYKKNMSQNDTIGNGRQYAELRSEVKIMCRKKKRENSRRKIAESFNNKMRNFIRMLRVKANCMDGEHYFVEEK